MWKEIIALIKYVYNNLLKRLNPNKMDKPTYDKEMLLKLLYNKVRNKKIGSKHFESVMCKFTSSYNATLLYDLIQGQNYSYQEFKEDIFNGDESDLHHRVAKARKSWFEAASMKYQTIEQEREQVIDTYE